MAPRSWTLLVRKDRDLRKNLRRLPLLKQLVLPTLHSEGDDCRVKYVNDGDFFVDQVLVQLMDLYVIVRSKRQF